MITKIFMIFFPFSLLDKRAQSSEIWHRHRDEVWFDISCQSLIISTSPSSHIAVVVRAPRAIVNFLSLTRQFRNWRSHFYDDSGLRSSSHSFAHFMSIFLALFSLLLIILISCFVITRRIYGVRQKVSFFFFFCLISPSSLCFAPPKKKEQQIPSFCETICFLPHSTVKKDGKNSYFILFNLFFSIGRSVPCSTIKLLKNIISLW